MSDVTSKLCVSVMAVLIILFCLGFVILSKLAPADTPALVNTVYSKAEISDASDYNETTREIDTANTVPLCELKQRDEKEDEEEARVDALIAEAAEAAEKQNELELSEL